MSELFHRGELRDYLAERSRSGLQLLEQMPEDEVLARSTEDLVQQLAEAALVEPLVVANEPVDGGVTEIKVEVYDHFDQRRYSVPGLRIYAIYEFSGNPELLHYTPSTRLLTAFNAAVGNGTLTVQTEQRGSTPDPTSTKQALDREIANIRTMAGHAATDVLAFNASLEGQFRSSVEARKQFLQNRRSLAGALGFPLKKRSDAPPSVSMRRKTLGVQRTKATVRRPPYKDEPALSEAQYEDAIAVISSALLSMERTPSVASGKDEESLRDYILVMLNGTFEGNATGETFVRSGKTDVLIRVENRHVFVGECKWWRGAKALAAGIEQLLGYLPWRDEKAALIVFIDNKDASSVFDKIEQAVRGHSTFKRPGKVSWDKTKRRNFVLGHPEDPEREIKLAVLFAVLPKA